MWIIPFCDHKYSDLASNDGNLMETSMILGKFHHDLTGLPHWKSWFFNGISSPLVALIHVWELLQFTQNDETSWQWWIYSICIYKHLELAWWWGWEYLATQSYFDMHAPWNFAMWLAAHENVKAMLLTMQNHHLPFLALILFTDLSCHGIVLVLIQIFLPSTRYYYRISLSLCIYIYTYYMSNIYIYISYMILL